MKAIFEFNEHMPIEITFPKEPRGVYWIHKGTTHRPVCVHFTGEPTLEQIKSKTYCNLLMRWQRQCLLAITIQEQDPSQE